MALPVGCPLCGAGSERQSVVTPRVYGDREGTRAFFHCAGCDVFFQHPRLTQDEETRFYTAEFEKFMAGRSGEAGGWLGAEAHIQANEPTRQRRMKYLEPLLARDASILEVGCSSGFMLFPLAERGHECVGVEPSGVFREYVHGRGLSVYESVAALKSAEPRRHFDIVQHFFVLEHIGEPHVFLEDQLALLRPGGRLVFEIPNAADALRTIFDIPAFERFYWSIAHPWYFTERSIRFVLDRIGHPYEILLDQRYDLSNHMTWARDGKPGGMGRYTEALGAELEETYRQSLVRSGHCDTLIGVITKA
jgi:SAM-dependent methyltransferase